ncbi:hypothetical protein [Segetibacter koreensis]|uniref:hypothetical protein n=1 Tax=Segetibacter koreensis TaxID=398037 RepID=UPI0003628EBA|nr:hypothetical protein [Segetibacter koreensis]
MKRFTIVTAITCVGMLLQADIHAQGFLKKLKDKASDVSNRVIDRKVDKAVDKAVGVDGASDASNSPETGGSPTRGTSSRSGRPSNKVGEGLKNTTPPDVIQQISEAETAQSAGNLSDARYSIQQALLGIELQMGKEVLKSLPSTVAGLPKDTTEDRVTSTQWGWANLTIQRIYRQDDKQLTVLVGNNSAYAGFVNIFFAGNYTQSNGDTQNFKQIKVKGNKAVIRFDQNEGYTVLVQLGQNGMITFEGVNFATEQDMMTAINTFDIDGIKKMLGEK